MSPPDFLPFGEGDAPVFAEPWQAEAFAMVVSLHASGLFTWPEWAATLSAELARLPPEASDGSQYYVGWVRALEAMLVEKGVATPGVIAATTEAWHRAAHATPHGRPILLENDPGVLPHGASVHPHAPGAA
ncbi:nitrile hydratase accessory protein [Aureimonas sp. SA4125]|uniref:nitrile hydratase accessory protein n=1 Tax=Aureimonas sp. SA4125 TaxID=2826993 RepID=UPI001CC60901|nr:nitrile hydratase accessory protein [Aureimonas sp. SA4125]BDA85515.1 nitrile hydratase accessory protein [Aureimonas sp. SA4125]